MTRTLLAIAAALIGSTTLLAPAAEACISCNYTPEVAHTRTKSHGVKSYGYKYVATPSQQAAARAAKVRAAKAAAAQRKIEAAKAADSTKTAVTETEPAIESKPVATATTVETETTPAVESKTEESKVADVGCKKFIPAVGITVTVACE